MITPKSTDPSASLCAVVATGIGAFASAAISSKVNSPVISGISTAELFVKRLNAFTGIWLSSYSKPATFVNSRVLGVVVSWAVATSLPVWTPFSSRSVTVTVNSAALLEYLTPWIILPAFSSVTRYL